MIKNKIIQRIEEEQMSKQLPDFGPGDTVTVQVKIKEGDRERLQAFEGVVRFLTAWVWKGHFRPIARW